ncbi:hypothetical protein [Paractinoplanes durhamensis]|uniref:Lipoprotein n=1 Tax=Paractinoplanes durhamensis TaxID=113563 RepID=A0ABQ3Z7U7_9ACTN|nr:hypothetical protein [Actinoplanes durhamensis]GIE05907.1 hypothetical protein Adu01nite_72570 [Actinoplanes durhamensis]
MRPHFLSLSAALLLGCLAACGGSPEAAPTTSASATPTGDDTAPQARVDLAAKAALAQDKAYAALYTLDDDGDGRQHNVVATIAADGTWRVDVSDAMLGSTTDVSIVSTAAGLYQCTVASASNPVIPSCVKVAAAGKRVPKDNSPQVERLFRQWLPVFRDRQAALSVTEVQPLSGAQGTCYSIDSIAASIKAPVDIGIYCYAADGVLTAARVGFGVLKLVSQVAGPKTVPLPGPESPGPAMGQDAVAPPVELPSTVASPA